MPLTIAETPSDLAIYHGSFRQIAPKLVSIPIVGFDTEDDTYGKPLSFAFYSDEGSFFTTSADEAIDYIYLYPRTAYFVAHNLEYDIGNLFKPPFDKYLDEMVYASRMLKATMIGTKHSFLNTSSFFAGSLKKMGELMGCPKLEGNSLDPAYNIRDAEIPYRFMKKFQDRLHNSIGINLGVSIGQLSMAAYRSRYMQKKIQITYNPPSCVGKDGSHGAYYGGRVEMFYKGIVKGPVYVADINSCYPKVMRDFPYPATEVIEHSSIHTHDLGVGKFTVKVPPDIFVPPLPYRSDTGRLFFPTGTFTGYWTYAEMRYAMELGVEILAEHSGEGTNVAEYPFSDFITDFYGQRLKHKKILLTDPDNIDSKFEDLFLKLFQNNLYGKWCQHKPSTKMTRYRLPPHELAKLKIYKEFKVGPFYSYTIERETPPPTANYLWGTYVTSYARIYLHKQLMEVVKAGGKIIYCDTDSVMFTGPCGGLKFGSELGELSLEAYDLGIFRQAKGYLLCKKEERFYYSKGKRFSSEALSKHNAMDGNNYLTAICRNGHRGKLLNRDAGGCGERVLDSGKDVLLSPLPFCERDNGSASGNGVTNERKSKKPEIKFYYSKGRVFSNEKGQIHSARNDRGNDLSLSNLRALHHESFRKRQGLAKAASGNVRTEINYVIKKVACKGVPTHMALEFITKGAARFLKPMRMKEANVRMHAEANRKKDEKFFSEVGVNYWREVEKEMKSVYIKRKGKTGVTRPIDVEEIPEMEALAYGHAVPMEEELQEAGLSLRNAKEFVNVFRGVKVPDGWFKRTNEEAEIEAEFESQKIHHFNLSELTEVPGKTYWFKGKIIEGYTSKHGKKYFKIFVKEFMGEKVTGKSMIGLFSQNFVRDYLKENFSPIGKRVEFFLNKKYFGSGPLNLAVKLSG